MKHIDLRFLSVFKKSPVLAGFTTRGGGVSVSPFDSLNFGIGNGDDQTHVAENYRLFGEYAGVSEGRIAMMRQVHGTTVRAVTEGGIYSDTDGLITDTHGLVLGVRVADCVPLLLLDPVRLVVGAVHCGWRSIAGGIAEKAIMGMVEQFGCRVSDIRAASGPSAGPCCYEVGPDTARHFSDSSVIKRDGTLYIDLKGEITTRLLAEGFERTNIEHSSDCTICNSHNYFSYRRDGEAAGRMMGFILIQD